MIDHDQLFKELLSTFFLEFLELFYPRLAEKIERDTVKFLPQEYFVDLTIGEKQIIDLLAEVKLAGQDAGILIHIEAQSTTQADFDRRMFFYFARLYQKYLRKVYPIVLFSFDRPLRQAPHTHRVEIDDFKILEFNFASIQLNRLNWRDYLTQKNPVAAALMAKMKIEPEERPKVKAECLRLLATLKLNPAKTQLISGFVDTYLKLNAQDEAQFTATISRMEISEREDVMQIVTSWMEQGIEQGRETEAKSLVLRQISKRFGALSTNFTQDIQTLSLSQVEQLSEALLDFTTIHDLSAWMQTQSQP